MSKSKHKNSVNKKLHEKVKKESFDTKRTFIKYAKRYGIVLAIALPIMMVVNYILSINVPWFRGAVSLFITFAMLLFACLMGLIIFSKIDEKRNLEGQDPEKERDPFAD